MSYNRFGRRSENDERFFLFVYSGGTSVLFRIQQELLQYVQGTHPVLEKCPDIKCRRIAEWYKWATNSASYFAPSRRLMLATSRKKTSPNGQIRVTIAVESGANEPAGIRSDACGNTKAAAEVQSHQRPPKSKILDL
eukprot:scaffold66238_cov43-Cyclotella_meneghiniana.AAC.8